MQQQTTQYFAENLKTTKMSSTFRLALIQLAVDANKAGNLARAAAKVKEAAEAGAQLVSLPECFNSPYGTKYFPEYAESVPDGESCAALKKMATENKASRTCSWNNSKGRRGSTTTFFRFHRSNSSHCSKNRSGRGILLQ